MKWLVESGWKAVTAAEVEAFYRGEKLPRKSVMLTFDDGWLDNWRQIFPVLQEFNVHADLCLVPGNELRLSGLYIPAASVEESLG